LINEGNSEEKNKNFFDKEKISDSINNDDININDINTIEDDYYDEEEDIISMVNSDGVEKEYYVIGEVEYESNIYRIVMERPSIDDLENIDDDIENMDEQVLVLKQINNNSEIEYESVEDDDLSEKIINIFESEEVFESDENENNE
jgi:hypothetical protein